MQKIVMFEGDIETQEYFSYQMKERFEQLGYSVYMYHVDPSKERASISGLMRFVEPGNTSVVSFNFHGMTPGDLFYDQRENRWFWDDLRIPCYNIVVDHPFYYHRFLDVAPKGYVHISIDRKHDLYMKQYYSKINRIPFLPLGGTKIEITELIRPADLSEPYQRVPEHMTEKQYLQSLVGERGFLPMQARPIDIVFTGNYTHPHKFDKYINRLGEEYAQFYRGILDHLLQKPWETLENVAKEHLIAEIPEITREELRETMGNLIFLDLYVRSYVRGKVVQTLVDGGFQVHVFGQGWEDLPCKHRENLIEGKGVDSLTCLKKIALSRISLNVMPWFKDGAHDRVFNTQLNGALLVTDSSIYLDEILKDKEHCLFYDLGHIRELPEKIRKILKEPEQMEQIVNQAYDLAWQNHTWAQRADYLAKIFSLSPETKMV